MAKKLPTEDFRYVRGLWQDQVLKRVQPHRLFGYREAGVIFPCADGHEKPDFMRRLESHTNCLHTFGANGGSIWLDPEFRDPNFNEEEHAAIRKFWVHQFLEAFILKGTLRGITTVHFNCGKLTYHQFTMEKILEGGLRARRYVQGELSRLIEHSKVRQRLLERGRLEISLMIHYRDGSEQEWAWVNHKHACFKHLHD